MVITERHAVYASYATRELFVAGGGPAIVLLHGFGDSADTWRSVMHRMEAAGRSAIAVDLPGFGDADDFLPGQKLRQLEAFVDDVVRRHGAAQPVVLVGNSLGGLLTMRAAAIERELPVRGALGLGSAGTGWTPLLQLATRGNLASASLLARLPIPRWLLRRVLAMAVRSMMYGRRRTADPAQVHAFVARLEQRPVLATALALLPEVNALAGFAKVACPTIVLQGGRDRLVSVEAAQRLHRAIPGSRMVVLRDIGHCPQLDAPDEVAAHITELADAQPGRTHGVTA